MTVSQIQLTVKYYVIKIKIINLIFKTQRIKLTKLMLTLNSMALSSGFQDSKTKTKLNSTIKSQEFKD